MINVFFDCGRFQYHRISDQNDYGDEDDDYYPPCDFVEDCSDCSHEKECFPDL